MVCCFLLEIGSQSKLELDSKGDAFCESSVTLGADIRNSLSNRATEREKECRRRELLCCLEKNNLVPHLGVKEILFSTYPSRGIALQYVPCNDWSGAAGR